MPNSLRDFIYHKLLRPLLLFAHAQCDWRVPLLFAHAQNTSLCAHMRSVCDAFVRWRCERAACFCMYEIEIPAVIIQAQPVETVCVTRTVGGKLCEVCIQLY